MFIIHVVVIYVATIAAPNEKPITNGTTNSTESTVVQERDRNLSTLR